MKTAEVEIDWNGKKELVRLRRLTFGEINQLTEDSTDIRVSNGQPVMKISQKVMRENGLLKSIVEAPFTICLSEIQNLDFEIGTKLFQAFEELNSQESKKKD